jgi:hypothetical protein
MRTLLNPWTGPLAIGLVACATAVGPASARASGVEISCPPMIIRTGYLDIDRRGQFQGLEATFEVLIRNESSQPCQTSAQLAGGEPEKAELRLVANEASAEGQKLRFAVAGRKRTDPEIETFVTVESKQDGKVVAQRSIPLRVTIPWALKLGDPVYAGPAKPGLRNRVLNMRTVPKVAVQYPEAQLAQTCFHDCEFTVLDQYDQPLAEIYANAPIYGALGEGRFENTNRVLSARATLIDSVGTCQYVGELMDLTIESGRFMSSRFETEPTPPLRTDQYHEYEPLLLQYQIGGHSIGTYQRTMTLKRSGSDSHPDISIVLKSADALPPKPTKAYFDNGSGELQPVDPRQFLNQAQAPPEGGGR